MSKMKEREENIIMIAEFMEWKRIVDDGAIQLYEKDGVTIHIGNLKYDQDWSLLMPVLEKIGRLVIGDDIDTIKHAYPRTFGMLEERTGNLMVRLNGFGIEYAPTLMEATYKAVVVFIGWYNRYLAQFEMNGINKSK